MIIFRAGGAYDEHNIAASVHTYAHFYNLTPPWCHIYYIFTRDSRTVRIASYFYRAPQRIRLPRQIFINLIIVVERLKK